MYMCATDYTCTDRTGVGGRTCNDVTCMNAVVSLQCRSVVGLFNELGHMCELSVNEERCQLRQGIKTVFATSKTITSLA